MFHSPAVCFALYFSLAVVVGLPLGLGGCQALLTQIDSLQSGALLETAITWKQRDLARPLLNIQVRNIADAVVMAVAVTCEFQDAMGVTIVRSRPLRFARKAGSGRPAACCSGILAGAGRPWWVEPRLFVSEVAGWARIRCQNGGGSGIRTDGC